MKKIKFFLILLIALLLSPSLLVKAATTSFYEGEYIEGIWINKYNPFDKVTYYQKARFFREVGTNDFAYCVQAFRFFKENQTYTSTENTVFDYGTRDKIIKIAHFGYGYKNHTDPKWYAVTQYMIWKTSDPYGDIYFTDSLNGNRINAYTKEINEINSLIANYDKLPSFANQTIDLVEDNSIVITDTNNVISEYKTNSDYVTINNNQVTISNLKEGEYDISFIRQDNYYNKPRIFWNALDSQQMLETGDLENKEIKIKVKVQKTDISLTKIDADTKESIPQGNASLDGAIYNLYDKDNNFIDTLEIINGSAQINNINYGTYYLKEESPGVGYNLDTNTYEITLSKDNPSIIKTLENKVIKALVTINKKYGDSTNMNNEPNINFNLYNSKNNLFATLTTNSNGIITIELPYDTYRLEQLNTTPGYSKIEPLTIDINNNDNIAISLQDYRIPVPNTHINELFSSILRLFFLIIC